MGADKKNSLHEVMLYLVNEYGSDILVGQHFTGLVSDYLGGEYPFYPIIKRASITNIGDRMITLSQQTSDYTIVIDNMKQAFQEENFLNYNAASYLIECYAYALGMIQEVEADPFKKEKVNDGEPLFIETVDGEFCGYKDPEGLRRGFGILREPDGYYAGDWKFDMRMGMGIGLNQALERYAGQWKYNKREGFGIELLDDGKSYSGQWKNDKWNGIGTLYFPNGETLCAHFKDNKISDTPGIWYLKDNTFIQGKMTFNGPTGLCFHILHDGTIVEEYWDNGRLQSSF